MGNKKHQLLSDPQLDIAHVQSALESLLYKMLNGERLLGQLLLIDRIVNTPEFPHTEHDYQFVLWELLTTSITNAYHHHRMVHCLDIPSEYCHIDTALTFIRQESLINSPELTAWSWLYHHYVRYDLAISQPQFAESACVDPRTIRRHGKHGIRRLTERLIYEERKLRREYRQNRLYTRLPIPVALPVFGRDALLKHMAHMLADTQPRHLQIMGKQGVGKSMLVHKFVHQLIDNQQIDDLAWVKAPSSISDIRTALKLAFLRDSGFTSVADYCQRFRVMIVIDDADDVCQNALDDLLAELGGAIVIVIGRNYRSYSYINAHMEVTELDAESAKSYIRYLGGRYSRGAEYVLTNNEIEQIYVGAGGHPAKIRATLDHWWCAEIDQEATRPFASISA